MTESFLRKDFHFALYLSYCYGKVLTSFFRLNLLMLFIVLPIVVVLSIVMENIPNEDVKLYIWLTLVVIAFLTIILIKSCLTSVEKKVTPNVFDDQGALRDSQKFDICFNAYKGAVNPFLDYDKLPRMAYLDTCDGLSELNPAEKQQFEDEEERALLLRESR